MTLLFVLSAFVSGHIPHDRTPPCHTAERESYGVVFCTPKNVSFTLVGRTAGKEYSIYDYHYKLRSAGGVVHGGQRLIVFQGDEYVGNYMLLPRVTIAVSGTQVVLKGDGDSKTARIDFSLGPPPQILVNGEVATFGR